jgi:hypothetical protein
MLRCLVFGHTFHSSGGRGRDRPSPKLTIRHSSLRAPQAAKLSTPTGYQQALGASWTQLTTSNSYGHDVDVVIEAS